MDRFIEKELRQWVARKRRKPLVIRGARQVGKSTVVRDFVQRSSLQLHELNLEKNVMLDRVFATLDMNTILRELEGLVGRPIRDEDGILFLDEIQATPHVLQALRYFYEDRPNLAVISAGSLLEFALSDHDFSMPVGRIQYLQMGPMTFEEYLEAVEPELRSHLAGYEWGEPFAETLHRRLLARQREYVVIGGMPEALAVFIESSSLSEAASVQSAILDTYLDDFPKYASGKTLARLHTVFNYIPRAVGEKLKYTKISRDENARELRHAVELLSKARVMTQVCHSDCSGLPLLAEADPFTFKPLFLDVGLMNRHCGFDWRLISSLSEQALVNEGPIAEQFIGQHLLATHGHLDPPRLCYWLREGRANNAEVDYVVSRGEWIVPIEVKAGKSGTLKSLLQFAAAKGSQIAVRFDLNRPSAQWIEHRLGQPGRSASVRLLLLSLPLYLVGQLPRLLDAIREGGVDAFSAGRPNE
ncbi:MAG: ATP-binding protein [Kiritimatiellae bacterium]|nr:ATP-binding protein [Kiritimatiellia bacterium]